MIGLLRSLRQGSVRAAVAGAVTAAAFMVSSPAHAATSTYQYSFSGPANHSETATGEPGDTGLCSPVETITFQGKFSVHVAATQPGLSDDKVLAALNDNDPIVVRVHFIEHGSFTLQAAGHTYAGQYVSAFGGQINSRTMVFRGSFSATGKSDADTQLVIHFSGHGTFFDDGAPRISKEHLRVTGCVSE
jgi:hypothetical protein